MTFEPYIDEVFSIHNDWESRTSAVVREIDRLVYDRNLVNFLKNVNPICRENQERFWKLYDEYLSLYNLNISNLNILLNY